MKYRLELLPKILELLYRELRIAVIYSGDNQREGAVINRTYHPRYWKSYRDVAEDIQEALEAMGFRHVSLLADDLHLTTAIKRRRIQLAWLNTGGVQGKNAIGHSAALLEMLGIPYIGHSPLSYMNLDHKLTCKRLLRSMGIATPDFFVWDWPRFPERAAFFRGFQKKLGSEGPWVLKPITGRASRYIQVAGSLDEVWAIVGNIFQKTYNQVLIESYLPGKEYCVACGPGIIRRNGIFLQKEHPHLFSFLERKLVPGEAIFTSIDTKAIDPTRARVLNAAQDAEIIQRLERICRTIYRELSLTHLVRIDLRETANGELNVLEINPKPDLKKPCDGASSLVLLGLEKMRVDYLDLIAGLLASFLDYGFRFHPPSVKGIRELLQRGGQRVEMLDPTRSP